MVSLDGKIGLAEAIGCDLGDRDSIAEMVTRAAERFDGLDVLVNNAGAIETAFTAEPARGAPRSPRRSWTRSTRSIRRRCG